MVHNKNFCLEIKLKNYFCQNDKKVLTSEDNRYMIIMVKETIKEAVTLHKSLKQDQMYITVDTLILTVINGKLCLLLSLRRNPPYDGMPALPGRIIGRDETAEETAWYLMNEMLPGGEPFLEQLYTFTEVDRDPRGRVISVAYLAIIPQRKLAKLLEEQETTLQPFRIDTEEGRLQMTGQDGTVLTGSDLAFDHGRIIETGVKRLQNKIGYTDIGFRFLNNANAFSLSELQTVFEAVLNMELDSSNFRRSILNQYEKSGRLWQTAQEERRGRGRPAVLYRFDL